MHVNTNRNTIIGENVTIGHGVLVHTCTIKNRSLIGNKKVIYDEAIMAKIR